MGGRYKQQESAGMLACVHQGSSEVRAVSVVTEKANMVD